MSTKISPNAPTEKGILGSLSSAVVALDCELKFLFLNPAAESLLAVSRQRTLGMELGQVFIIDNDEGQPFGNAIDLVREQGFSVMLREGVLRHREQFEREPVLVDCAISLLHSPNQKRNLLLELSRVDKLARIRREDELREQHAANRAMIRGLSHEIKNPLGGLRGAAQLLDAELKERDMRQMREYTRIITHEADRLTRLVDRFTAPIKPVKKIPVNIHDVLEYVHKLVSLEVREAITIKRDYDPSLPEVLGDREALIQMMLNITRNAQQILMETAKDKVITLRTRCDRQITIQDQRHRQVIRTDIIDNGPGINMQIRDHIFYPMVTGRADGTGLGLSIAQEIAEQHHGMIECVSTPGETYFSIFLPIPDKRKNT